MEVRKRLVYVDNDGVAKSSLIKLVGYLVIIAGLFLALHGDDKFIDAVGLNDAPRMLKRAS